ncbi:MAG: hypothetical protein Q9180_010013, partial [Flavoplaca navasiana]
VARNGFGRHYGRAPDIVHLPGKGEEVEGGEDGHFDTQKKRRDTNSEIRALQALGGLNGATGGQERDEDGLPEREEDDKFNSSNLEQGTMLGQVFFELNVELNEAVHGYSDAGGLDQHYLGLSMMLTMPMLIDQKSNVPRYAQMLGGATQGNSARLLL